jgi:glycosyltransferase involved in cell wall biosynthesis
MALRVLTALGGGPVGGAEAFFVTLTTAFETAGLPVRAVLRNAELHTGALKRAGVPFDTAPFGGPLDFSTRRKLARIAAEFRPDIALTFAGRASAHMPRGPYRIVGRLGGYYNLSRFRRCDALVCNTPDLVRYVIAGGWPKTRVFHIPNFPNLESGAAVPRASLDTPVNARLVLAMGRFHPNKAFDVLLRAMVALPGIFLWLAGEGDERGALEALAKQLGIADRVRFLGWRTDRAALFGAADLCVVPSRSEPFGNVVIEAWGYGVPVVATASTGPAWLIRAGADGLLTPVDDAAALADAMRAVLASPVLAGTLVRNGRARIEQEFSQDAVVDRYVEMFEQVLALPGQKT